MNMNSISVAVAIRIAIYVGLFSSISCHDIGGGPRLPTDAPQDRQDTHSEQTGTINGRWKPASVGGTITTQVSMRMVTESITETEAPGPYADSITGAKMDLRLAIGNEACTLLAWCAGTERYTRTVSIARFYPVDSLWYLGIADTLGQSARQDGINHATFFKMKNDRLVMQTWYQINTGTTMLMCESSLFWQRAETAFPPVSWPTTVIDVPMDTAGLAKKAGNILIPISQCTTWKCGCEDLPDIERFTETQKSNLEAWRKVRTDALTGNVSSLKEARNAFGSYATRDPQLMTECLGGHSGRYELGSISSGIMVDSCMCATQCDIVVNSVAFHEKTHIAANLGSFFSTLPVRILARIAGSTGFEVGTRVEGIIDAYDLSVAEVVCHEQQLLFLQSRIAFLRLADDCCLSNLAKAQIDEYPETMTGRFRMLSSRLWAAFTGR